MRVTFAGGVGEHGRNCFLVEGETLSFLVDCGRMAGAQDPYPALTAAQARGLDFVFLTHSHADHTGALAWLAGLGCSATVVATSATLSQVGRLPFPTVCLENNPPPAGLELAWGRAGHCAGSVWYAFGLEGQRLFFCGDYTEHSPVYAVDPVRGQAARLAVLDSAYGPDPRSDGAMRQDFLDAVSPWASAGQPVLFPVPKYGRGQEMLLLLHARWPQTPLYGDAHFCKQTQVLATDQTWVRPEARAALHEVSVLSLGTTPPAHGFCFLSGPQLRTPAVLALAEAFAKAGGVVLTGAVDPGSGAARLAGQGLARFARVPVHCTDRERQALAEHNAFQQVVPYHTADHPCPQRTICLGTEP